MSAEDDVRSVKNVGGGGGGGGAGGEGGAVFAPGGVFFASAIEVKTPPFCLVCSTAFVRLRRCLCFVCSHCLRVAKTVPLPCVFCCHRG